MRRRVQFGIAALVAVIASPWLTANIALNFYLPTLLDDTPDRVLVRWQYAYMVFPGHVHVRGLHVSGKGRIDRWTLDLPVAEAAIDVGALRERRFVASNLEATGGSYRYDLRDDPEPDRPRAPAGPWNIEIPGVQVRSLDLVEIRGHRFDGDADVVGSLFLRDDVDAEFVLTLRDGAMSVDERSLASATRGELSLTLRDLPRFGPIGGDVLDRLDAHAALDARADDLSLLGVYLQKVPWLTLSGTADVRLDAVLTRGLFAPGTRATATTDALSVGVLSYRVDGDAVLTMEVVATPEGGRTRASAVYGAFAILEADAEAIVNGTGFTMTLEGGEPRLGAPFDELKLRLDLPQSSVQNLRAYTGFLPVGSGVQVTGGRGVVSGHLDADAISGAASGEMNLAIEDLAASMDELDMVSDVRVHLGLPRADMNAGTYVLSGSTIHLDRFGFVDEPTRDWWARLTLAQGTATAGANTYFSSNFELECATSRPFLLLASQRASLAPWIQDLLDVRDLKGTTSLQLRTDAIVVERLVLEGGAAELRLNLTRREKKNEGAAFARLGPLAIGVGFAAGERRWHPLGARNWYNGQVGEGPLVEDPGVPQDPEPTTRSERRDRRREERDAAKP